MLEWAARLRDQLTKVCTGVHPGAATLPAPPLTRPSHPPPSPPQFADSEALKQLHDDARATLQLHQPQRFVNACWRLLAALESQLGCLVGCNAYVTPPGGQGLAPHHDDVELFVCQTQGEGGRWGGWGGCVGGWAGRNVGGGGRLGGGAELQPGCPTTIRAHPCGMVVADTPPRGLPRAAPRSHGTGTKSWKLYKPAEGCELPYNPSGDLEQVGVGWGVCVCVCVCVCVYVCDWAVGPWREGSNGEGIVMLADGLTATEARNTLRSTRHDTRVPAMCPAVQHDRVIH